MHLKVKVCKSVTGNLMSAPCESIVKHSNHNIPVCAHLLLITCRAHGVRMHLFSISAELTCSVSVCETNTFSADSDCSVCEELQP